ncbi:MAG TPA: twin-arginine translocase TatA/TatE family subunit [Acidobacteriaceae bacterium]|jgi:sec-independent protein translocase protein TatA|nr:twin-arginine translocase TatA/TatE family subunit [Acidobacteriaceae bacterium]
MEFQPWHILVVLVIAVLLFGGKKLPELGKGLGEGWRGFKDGLSGTSDTTAKTPPANPVETTHAVTPKPDETQKS